MRVVRYVGAGDDERHLLVETVEGDEKFSLYVTDELRSAASIDLPRLNQGTVESVVSPREIQMRVRGGESPEQIADQSGMALDKVLRFASAVVAERARITGEARSGRARRNSPDGEFVVFGEHVDARFTAHGIEPSSVSWDSYRNDEGGWVITAGWHGGDLKRIARWAFALAGRTVSPIDDTSADLLSDRPIRPVMHVVYDIPIDNPAESPTGPIPSPGARDELFDQELAFLDAARNRDNPPQWGVLTGLPSDPGTYTDHVAGADPEPTYEGQHEDGNRFGFFADSAGSAAGAASDRPGENYPANDFASSGYAPGEDYTSNSYGPNGAASNDGRSDYPEPAAVLPLRGVPDLPLIPGMAEESEEDKAARARIPSWDDILLGVRRKRD